MLKRAMDPSTKRARFRLENDAVHQEVSSIGEWQIPLLLKYIFLVVLGSRKIIFRQLKEDASKFCLNDEIKFEMKLN